MLTLFLKPHRPALKSGTSDPQKVFALLKAIPRPEVASQRPSLALALVIDTSSSMLEFADEVQARQMAAGTRPEARFGAGCGLLVAPGRDEYVPYRLPLPTKLDQAIEAGHRMVDDPRLAPQDRMMVVKFDDEATTVLPLAPVADRQRIHDAIDSLRKYSGGTYLGAGLSRVREGMAALGEAEAKRAVILTDGKAMDEEQCAPVARHLGARNVGLIPLGLGDTYNQELLLQLAGLGRGRHFHLKQVDELAAILADELGALAREVVTDVKATVSSVKGVTLDRVQRVFPSQAPVEVSSSALRLGNVPAGEFSCFIFEFTVSEVARPPCHARIAQVSLAAYAPALERHEDFAPLDLLVDFTTDEGATGQIDPEVMHYVQQMNLDAMLGRAVQLATLDASKARETINAALRTTRAVGNPGMTRLLEGALEELNARGTISAHLGRTIRAGGRTMTVKAAGTQAGAGLTDEEIRRITGV